MARESTGSMSKLGLQVPLSLRRPFPHHKISVPQGPALTNWVYPPSANAGIEDALGRGA